MSKANICLFTFTRSEIEGDLPRNFRTANKSLTKSIFEPTHLRGRLGKAGKRDFSVKGVSMPTQTLALLVERYLPDKIVDRLVHEKGAPVNVGEIYFFLGTQQHYVRVRDTKTAAHRVGVGIAPCRQRDLVINGLIQCIHYCRLVVSANHEELVADPRSTERPRHVRQWHLRAFATLNIEDEQFAELLVSGKEAVASQCYSASQCDWRVLRKRVAYPANRCLEIFGQVNQTDAVIRCRRQCLVIYKCQIVIPSEDTNCYWRFISNFLFVIRPKINQSL